MCEHCDSPARTAAVDQFFAKATADLNLLVDAFREARRDDERIEALDKLTSTLVDPSRSNGTQVSHEAHVSTMAGLLAVAIERLARA